MRELQDCRAVALYYLMNLLTFEGSISVGGVETSKVRLKLVAGSVGDAGVHLYVLGGLLGDVLLRAVVQDALHTEASHVVNHWSDSSCILIM